MSRLITLLLQWMRKKVRAPEQPVGASLRSSPTGELS